MNIGNVLSLFDGISCGQVALNRSCIKYDNYFASEIDKHAIKVTMKNFPATKQIGSVVDVKSDSLPKIDLIIGGSPCQSFSFAGRRKGMATKDEQEILNLEQYLKLKSEGYEFEGQSYLFWEYMRLLTELKPKYFFLENVEMGEKWERVLSFTIGVKPLRINSNLVSAQNRKRLYWTNIGMVEGGLFGEKESIITPPIDKKIFLKDILESNVDEKYYLSEKQLAYIYRDDAREVGIDGDKSICQQARQYASWQGQFVTDEIKGCDYRSDEGLRFRDDGKSPTLMARAREDKYGCPMISGQIIRRLTPIECERLQTLDDNYTSGISDSQRYKSIGNGWTVDVISHIFNYLKG
jgi:DNA (cytosine-5)-methyltransferase 3A